MEKRPKLTFAKIFLASMLSFVAPKEVSAHTPQTPLLPPHTQHYNDTRAERVFQRDLLAFTVQVHEFINNIKSLHTIIDRYQPKKHTDVQSVNSISTHFLLQLADDVDTLIQQYKTKEDLRDAYIIQHSNGDWHTLPEKIHTINTRLQTFLSVAHNDDTKHILQPIIENFLFEYNKKHQ